jgi:hypothetical protein
MLRLSHSGQDKHACNEVERDDRPLVRSSVLGRQVYYSMTCYMDCSRHWLAMSDETVHVH